MRYVKEYLETIRGNKLAYIFKENNLSQKDIDILVNNISTYFGYTKTKYFNSGAQGIIYSVNDESKVVKITADEKEAINASKLLNITTKYIVNYYDVRKVVSEKLNYADIYAIVLDKVIPCSIGGIERKILHYLEHTFSLRISTYLEVIEEKEEIYKNTISKFVSIYTESEIKKTLDGIFSILKECDKYNISFYELHGNNIGYKNNDLVFFDIGLDANFTSITSTKIKTIKVS